MPFYDMHTHTTCSHDAHQTPEELCRAALDAGLAGVAITDHLDTAKGWPVTNIENSVQNAADMAAAYAGQLRVLRGVEISDELWYPDDAHRVRGTLPFDVVLASAHGFCRDGQVLYLSQEPFDAAHYTDAQLAAFLRQYMLDLLATARDTDYDILAHLDYPLRYINGKHHRGLDLAVAWDTVDEILRTVIRRDKTLEVNTSGTLTPWGRRMPYDPVLYRYKELGGRRVCLSSDAHTGAGVAAGFAEAAAFLRQLGLEQTVYIGREPVTLDWT